jgi:choline dehydrogenase-like flavoprotein
LETFEGEIPKDMEKFAKPTEGAHGFKGPIGVGYGKEWMPLIDTYLEAADDALKCGIIPDYNDGNVVGASVAQFNIAGGERITSPVAYLKTIPKNLILWTEVEAHKIVFEGKRAVGVEFTKDGKTGIPDAFQALNIDTVICKDEIILSCGTIGSPALLLRSGITTKQNPAIGQNLTDHLILSLEFELNSSILSHHQILEDPELAEKALLAYREGKSGDLVKFGGSSGVIFPRLPRVFESKEFKEIEAETQKFLKEPGRPSTEIWFMVGP